MMVADHPATPTVPALTRSVAISDLTVTPNSVVVAPGTEVMWHNGGRNRHTVTADGGAFGSPTLIPGDDFTISAPTTPGVYQYHCVFHSYIRGTVTVSLVALTAPDPVTVGRTVTLTGAVPGAPAGTPVSVERRSEGAWESVGQAATDSAGAFTVMSAPLATRTAFRAVAGGSISPSIRAEVRPAISAALRGARLTISVRPATAGTPVHLQRLNLVTYRWGALTTGRLAGGRARFTLKGPGVYRAQVEARGGLSAGTSPAVEFRSGAFRQ